MKSAHIVILTLLNFEFFLSDILWYCSILKMLRMRIYWAIYFIWTIIKTSEKTGKYSVLCINIYNLDENKINVNIFFPNVR